MRSRASISVFVVWWLAAALFACAAMTRFTAQRLDESRAQNIADAVALVAVSVDMQRASEIAAHLSSSIVDAESSTRAGSVTTIVVRTPWGDSTSTAVAD